MTNSAYPAAIDSFANPGASTLMDDTVYDHDVQHSNVNDAVNAIETELGTNPKGSSASVKARLDLIETKIPNSLTVGTVTAGAAAVTITGTAPSQTINFVLQTGATGAQGAQGATGTPNTISIGTVTSNPTASATMTGSSPTQTLNLVLPTSPLYLIYLANTYV